MLIPPVHPPPSIKTAENPPSEDQCDINKQPKSLNTIDLIDVGMSTSEENDITSNKQVNIKFDFNTAKLLDRLEEIVLCLISRMRIKDPLCGPDMVIYENKSITEWISTRQSSPMTRIPMIMRDLIGNNVIKETIAAMGEYKIRDLLMKRVHQELESKGNKVLIETLSKAEKEKKKTLEQKRNNQLKKGAVCALKEHKKFMEYLG